MGESLGDGVPRLAHRVLLHLHEAFGGVHGHPLRRRGQYLPPPHQRDCPERGLSGTQMVQLLVPCAPPERQGGQDEQVQRGIPHRVPAEVQGL